MIYENNLTVPLSAVTIFSFLPSESVADEIIIIGGPEAIPQGKVYVSFQFSTGRRVPTFNNPTPGIGVLSGQRLTLKVKEMMPFPHSIMVTVTNNDTAAHVVQILLFTTEPARITTGPEEAVNAEVT